MFDFDGQFSPAPTHRIVAIESRKLSAEERQRDVFESHRHRVFSVGYYMTANEVEAEHILTDTFITAFARQVEPDGSGVDRALLGELERRFSLEPSETAVLDPALNLVKTSGRRTDMEEALRELPPAERLVFLLKDVEGYPAARIAALLERPEREVQRTIMSARIRMRNSLAAIQRNHQPPPQPPTHPDSAGAALSWDGASIGDTPQQDRFHSEVRQPDGPVPAGT